MQLATLGGLRLQGTDFTRPKPLLLLCYLAIEGPQSRRVLADLFFPDAKDPRDSLSTALRHLNAIREGLAVADGRSVACGAPCDASHVIEALDAGILEPALDLYEGPFLAGLDLELAEELEEWVFATREYLAIRVRDAHLRLAESLAVRGELTLAGRQAELALGLVEAPAMDPEEFPRVYRLLALGKSPMAAGLRSEAEEFGIDVDRMPVDSVPAGAPYVAKEAFAPHNLPRETSSFVGREAERLEVAGLLAAPYGRVLTIHGPGGMGKSRLALQAARDQLGNGTFPDGVFFVSVESVGAADRIPEAIASAIGMALSGSGTPIRDLADLLDEKHCLLLLDGFEHVVDGALLLSELIDLCPDLKLLVTSRRRLELSEEHVLTLRGLASPDPGMRFEDAVNTDALQLFVHRAKKARLDFTLVADDVPEAIAICRSLDGSPLGIELAVPWIRVMPLSDISEAIGEDLAFLETGTANVPEGHRSLRAVFGRSWNLLAPREQEVLGQLALFQGSFRREAAAEVAGATLPTLLKLVDASLLSMTQNGRYRLHALIHQFSRDRLAEDPALRTAALHRFQEHFRNYADRVLAKMYTSEEKEALDAIEVDVQNLVSAWNGILLEGRDPMRAFPARLVVFFDRRGRHREGIRFYETSVRAFEAFEMEDDELFAEVLANLAWLRVRIGDMAAAEELAHRTLARSDATSAGHMMAQNILGVVLRHSNLLAESRQRFANAVEIAEARGEENRAAMYLLNLANVSSDMGDHASATRDLQELIQKAEERDYPFLLVLSLNNLATIEEERGDYERARRLYERALELARASGYAHMEPMILANLAEISLEAHEPARARRLLLDAEAASEDVRDGAIEALMLDVLGRIQWSEGDVASAEESFRRGLELALAHRHGQRHLKVLVHLAELWLSAGRLQEASFVLHALREFERVPPSVDLRAMELRERMPDGVSSDLPTELGSGWLPRVLRLVRPEPRAQ